MIDYRDVILTCIADLKLEKETIPNPNNEDASIDSVSNIAQSLGIQESIVRVLTTCDEFSMSFTQEEIEKKVELRRK